MATFVFSFGVIIAIIFGIIFITKGDDLILTCILIIVAGIVFSWIAYCCMYGFGKLIENTDKLVAESHRDVSSKEDHENE